MRGFGIVGIVVGFLCPKVLWATPQTSPNTALSRSPKQVLAPARHQTKRVRGRNPECRQYFNNPPTISAYTSNAVDVSVMIRHLKKEAPFSVGTLSPLHFPPTSCRLAGCLSAFPLQNTLGGAMGCGLGTLCAPSFAESLQDVFVDLSPQTVTLSENSLSQQSAQELLAVFLYAQSQGWKITAEMGFQKGAPTPIYVAHLDSETAIEIRTAVAFHQMQQQARTRGVPLTVNSGFRTMAQQKEAYYDYCFEGGPLAARPGNSNHQLGYAVDINVKPKGVYSWLNRNAARHGFLRAVRSERWHWERLPENDLPLLASYPIPLAPTKRAVARNVSVPKRGQPRSTESTSLRPVVHLSPKPAKPDPRRG